MNFRNLWALLKRTFSAWNEHDAFTLSAAVAFYTILSLAPLVILLTSLVAIVFGHSSAINQIIDRLQSLIGRNGAEMVRTMVDHAQEPSAGIFASVVGIVTLLFSASGVFNELRLALNKMWDIRPPDGDGIMAFLKDRIVAIGMVLAFGFLLLLSLFVSIALVAMRKLAGNVVPTPDYAIGIINIVFSIVSIAVVFALVLKYVPQTSVRWRPVWIGAAVTSVLFTLGKYLIAIYLGRAAFGSAYGVAGSFIGITIWVYYSALIFFFGAEFTHELAMWGKAPARQPAFRPAFRPQTR